MKHFFWFVFLMALKALLKRQKEKKFFYTDSKFQVGLDTESTVKEMDFFMKVLFSFRTELSYLLHVCRWKLG